MLAQTRGQWWEDLVGGGWQQVLRWGNVKSEVLFDTPVECAVEAGNVVLEFKREAQAEEVNWESPAHRFPVKPSTC